MKLSTRACALWIVFIIVGSALCSLPALVKYAAQEGLRRARAGGVPISWSEVSGSMTGVHLTSLTVFAPGPGFGPRRSFHVPIPIEFRDVTARAEILPLFKLAPVLTIASKLYEGGFTSRLEARGGDANLSMDLSGAKLALHPALATLGVSSGTLTATIRDAIVRDNQLVAANFSASIGAFELPTNTPYHRLPIERKAEA